MRCAYAEGAGGCTRRRVDGQRFCGGCLERVQEERIALQDKQRRSGAPELLPTFRKIVALLKAGRGLAIFVSGGGAIALYENWDVFIAAFERIEVATSIMRNPSPPDAPPPRKWLVYPWPRAAGSSGYRRRFYGKGGAGQTQDHSTVPGDSDDDQAWEVFIGEFVEHLAVPD